MGMLSGSVVTGPTAGAIKTAGEIAIGWTLEVYGIAGGVTAYYVYDTIKKAMDIE